MSRHNSYRGEDLIHPQAWYGGFTQVPEQEMPSAEEMDDAMDLMNLQILMQSGDWYEMTESERLEILLRIENITNRAKNRNAVENNQPGSPVDDDIPF